MTYEDFLENEDLLKRLIDSTNLQLELVESQIEKLKNMKINIACSDVNYTYDNYRFDQFEKYRKMKELLKEYRKILDN